jgi:hypothetical protein
MSKRKSVVSKTIDYQMLDSKEILGKKIVDIYLHVDADGDMNCNCYLKMAR